MFIEVVPDKWLITTEKLRAVEVKGNTVFVYYEEKGTILKLEFNSRREALKRYRIILDNISHTSYVKNTKVIR